MRNFWRLSEKASFAEARRNTFIVTFDTEVDKDRVMASKPLLFDSYLFALKELKGCSQISKTQFITESFWTQLYDLPCRCMNRVYGNLIEKTIGQVLKINVEEYDMGWGLFLQV